MAVDRKPTAEYVIRPFEVSDQERVRWLFARTPPWGRTYPRPQALPDDLEDIPSNYPGGCFVAVEQDISGEAIVGLTAVAKCSEAEGLPDFIERQASLGRVHWVSVAPERWRLGIGHSLTEVAITWARSAECQALVLNTTVQQEGAIALYESLGFVQRGRTVSGPWHAVWLELVLGGGE